MALIQCKECGHMISDKATTCPKCGCAVAKPAVCSDCGEPLPEECTACPKCGCPVATEPATDTEPYNNEPKGKEKRTWLWVCLSLLLLVAIAVGIFLHIDNQRSSEIRSVEQRSDSLLLAQTEAANLQKAREDSIANALREKQEQERLEREGPDWLQGAWKLNLYDDYGNSIGEMYEVFDHGTSKSYIGSQLLMERSYTISGSNIVYDKGGNYTIDNNTETLTSADGRNFTKVSSDPSYVPSGSSSSGYSSSSGSGYSSSSSDRSYRFSSAHDVIGYLADKTFYDGSRRLRIRPDGVWLNNYCATGAPTVERYESWKALIRAYTATGERLSFMVDPINGQVFDEAGDVFTLR